MKKAALITLVFGVIVAGLAIAGIIRPPLRYALGGSECAPASCCGTRNCRCSPLGGYCKGSRWGWYGAGRDVKTPGEAGEAIRKFYLPERVNVSGMRDKSTFFEAEVKNGDDKVIDTVIVDKRTGRISSIY